MRQLSVALIFWAIPVVLHFFWSWLILSEATWLLHMIPSVLFGFRWGIRGAALASLISSLIIVTVDLITKNISDLPVMGLLVATSLFTGLLFERCRNKEETLRNAISELEQLVVTDPLTGVYNRRYLFDRLQAEVARGRRYNIPVSVVMLDLDSFKAYNDKYGHLAGDILLQNVAKIIRRALRQEDVVVRYGGDEFAVILTGADARSARITAERLRNTVKAAGMSISLGVVTYPQDGTTAEELLRRADYYLLAAKAAGKDRVYALQV